MFIKFTFIFDNFCLLEWERQSERERERDKEKERDREKEVSNITCAMFRGAMNVA